MIKFDDLELAFLFVNGGGYGMNSAYVDKQTGKTYFESDFGESDELPEDFELGDRYVEIPHKNDLGLGRDLVREFVEIELPERAREVDACFRGRGAYSRFKGLLEEVGCLEKWHQFEKERTEASLKDWCSEVGLEIS